jgi:superfamily II DNA or RNA helicase
MQLRDYQTKIICAIKQTFIDGNKRVIMCAPTGAGKTVMFSYMVKNAVDKGIKTLIITDRKELHQQGENSLKKIGLDPKLIDAKNKDMDGFLFVGMTQTITRNLNKLEFIQLIKTCGLIIIDEAHKTSFDKIIEYVEPNTFLVGATATPLRVGKQKGLNEQYDDLIQIVDVPDLIKLGFLSRPISFGVPVDLKGVKTKNGDYDEKSMGNFYSKNKIYTGVIENYKLHINNKKTLVFASNVENSKEITTEFTEQGYEAKHVDCYMTDKERKSVLEWFDSSENGILCNYGILTTGYDCPSIEAVILYRATKSLSLFLQMIGRGSRVTSAKSDFKILDFGNNIQTHGFWEDRRLWTLEKKQTKKKDKKDAAAVKYCKSCNAILKAHDKVCSYCGESQLTDKEKEFAKLVQLNKQEVECLDLVTLELYREAKGYKPGWLLRKFTTFKEFEEYGKLKKYKNGWAKFQYERYRG